jgi:crotonobetainyl-CoA:carnitine CoA-transferase CaiB-like acyl-CoA transferase
MGALAGIEVIDFSTLLPGPLATLLLAEAGATVTKIERPGTGDEMRSYEPRLGTTSVNFALLNRGKRSLQLDLKSPGARATLQPLLERADVLVEQFRPGVMERLGLGYDAVAAINPRLVYCSITGYGRDGDRAARAAHDLNYAGDAGLLDLVAGRDGDPVLPAVLVADIGGGAYPAVINILLAIAERERTGRGRRLDVAMADNVLTWMYWAIGNGLGAGRWPRRGDELLTGGSPRYHLYRTADGRHVAAAPLEDRFWANFCDLIDLPAPLRDDRGDPAATRAAVAALIAQETAAAWEARFARSDVCCSIVRTVQEAAEDPAFAARGLFAQQTGDGADAAMPALPVPIDPGLRGLDRRATAPRLEDERPAGSPADGVAEQ